MRAAFFCSTPQQLKILRKYAKVRVGTIAYVLVNAHVVIDDANFRMVGKPEVIQRRGGAKPIWTLARLCGSSKNTSAGTSR